MPKVANAKKIRRIFERWKWNDWKIDRFFTCAMAKRRETLEGRGQGGRRAGGVSPPLSFTTCAKSQVEIFLIYDKMYALCFFIAFIPYWALRIQRPGLCVFQTGPRIENSSAALPSVLFTTSCAYVSQRLLFQTNCLAKICWGFHYFRQQTCQIA